MKQSEIERKFLLKHDPSYQPDSLIRIDQFYIGEMRYRRSMLHEEGQVFKYEKIIKTSISEGVNEEEIFDVNKDEYKDKRKVKERSISKYRSVYYYEGLKFEVDDFRELKLVVCEVELKDINQLIIFPDYIKDLIIIEVTKYKEFSNYNLAK